MPCKHAEERSSDINKLLNNLEVDICNMRERLAQIDHDISLAKTLSINGFQVPEPMREKPEIGTRYWYIVTGNDSMTGWDDWAEDPLDNILLKRGICHTTKEAAIAHAKALFSFSEVG